jgi:hypothetical protein
MLPEASQAKKAIWNAVNPHTGIRRIDEAFPLAIRENTNNTEMFIRFKNGSTWQVVGSDNYDSLVGSPPVGVVFSEWALANPASLAYLTPILAENMGWAAFIFTPRGRNHGERILRTARRQGWFNEVLTVNDTKAVPQSVLDEALAQYIDLYGDEQGLAFYEQEFLCSFAAAILGSVYGGWIAKAEREGRIGKVECDRSLPVNTAWDLGYGDATSIWFWQMVQNEVRLIDYYEKSGKDVKHYCDAIKARNYPPGKHYVPPDAMRKVLEAGGRSVVEQAWDEGIKMTVVPATTQMNQIAAARATLPRCWFGEENCEEGLDALKSYHFEYDENRQCFRDTPYHDYSSHGSDAFEIVAQVWREKVQGKPESDMREVTPAMWRTLERERTGKRRALN